MHLYNIFNVEFAVVAAFLVISNEILPALSRSIFSVRVVMPPSISEGGSVTLLCLFDLPREELYSVKWYRGHREFYRFVPSDRPRARFFAFPGLELDMKKSNANQVTLLNVPRYWSGNFTCEVSADEPYFSTKFAYSKLEVLPTLAPDSGELNYFEQRQRLRLLLPNLTSSPPDTIYAKPNNGDSDYRSSREFALQASANSVLMCSISKIVSLIIAWALMGL